MKTERVTRQLSSVTLALALAFAAATSGCSSDNPPPGSVAYKSGTLGNGGFLFACDDGAACLPYSGDAAHFPTRVATGSTFDVRFVANADQGNDNQHQGITVQGVTPYIDRGGDGLAAVKPGRGTIIAYDAAGNVVDYTTIAIVQPKTLAVYDANSTIGAEKEPPRVESIDVNVGGRKSYRVLAEVDATSTSGGWAVAGSMTVEWTSSNPDVIRVDSYNAGVVNLVANKVGTATLTIHSAAISRDIAVKVQQ